MKKKCGAICTSFAQHFHHPFTLLDNKLWLGAKEPLESLLGPERERESVVKNPREDFVFSGG
jgi:hypothetical protein